MKKLFIFSLIIMMTLFINACDLQVFLTTESSNTTDLITDVSTTIEIDNTSTSDIQFSTTQEVTTVEITSQENTTVENTTNDPNQPIIPTDLTLIQDEIMYPGIPTEGSPKVLVFVVDFPDDEYFINNESEVLNDMEIAFNGSDTEIAYESLNSYYYKSSYGKLNLTADIYGVYTADYSASYYEAEYAEYYSDSDLVLEIVDAYSSEIDYSNYDYDDDGMIDGIYIVYNYPYDSNSEIWWAYQTIYMYTETFYNGVEPLNFTWLSLEFFYDTADPIDARTIIHETGHMLGLEDYYDYYDYDIYDNSGGLDGIDMMDSSLGDHNPFSKMMLGWITPIVVENSMNIDIEPFIESGEVILLIDEWKGTIFDEYILISYYTPTGLNEEDKYYLLSEPGIILYHVDARLGNNNSDYYPSDYTYNNTDTEFMLIKIIEKTVNVITYVRNNDLFLFGDDFGLTTYTDYTWHEGSDIPISVEISYMDSFYATINITFE